MIDKSQLQPGAGVCALVNEVQVALFYLPGLSPSLYAIGNHDPIGKANVLSRGIVGDIDGEPVVASPLYKQHFSLRSGRCIEDDSVSVPVHHAEMEGDSVRLRLRKCG